MFVALIILGEIASVVGTFVISFNTLMDSILEISKNGYKIDRKVMEEYREKQAGQKQEAKGFKKFINNISLFIPGVNLIRAGICYHKTMKNLMDDPIILKSVVRMSDEEFEKYESLNSKLEKITFAATMSIDMREIKMIGFSNNLPVIIDDGLISIHNDEVVPLDLTYDEVMELSNAAGGYHKIGLLDDIPVAFIAIPSVECDFDKVKFSFEDYKNTHNFKDCDDLVDSTFRVYQVIDNMRISSSVGSVISDIQRKRNANDVNKDMDDKLNELLLLEQSDENEKGVVLQKSIFPKNDN